MDEAPLCGHCHSEIPCKIEYSLIGFCHCFTELLLKCLANWTRKDDSVQTIGFFSL